MLHLLLFQSTLGQLATLMTTLRPRPRPSVRERQAARRETLRQYILHPLPPLPKMTSVERLYTLYNAIDDAKDKAGEVRQARGSAVKGRGGATPCRGGDRLFQLLTTFSPPVCVFLVFWSSWDGFVLLGVAWARGVVLWVCCMCGRGWSGSNTVIISAINHIFTST